MDSCLPLHWTNWSSQKSSVIIMLPIFLTPLKILFISGSCSQACHQTLHPPPLLPFWRVVGASQCITSAWPVPDVLWNSTGLPVTHYCSCTGASGVDAVHHENLEVFLLSKEGFTFRIRWSVAGARDCFLWPCLSYRPIYSLLACQSFFPADLHTFRLFLCVEWIPVIFPGCPSCGACNHPSHSSNHMSCSTRCL